MSGRDRLTVRDTASTSLAMFGVSDMVWKQVRALSLESLVTRCRTALAEIEKVDSTATSVSIHQEIAQTLLAACWTIAITPDLRTRLRAAMLELGDFPNQEVAMDRRRLVTLVRESIQGRQ